MEADARFRALATVGRSDAGWAELTRNDDDDVGHPKSDHLGRAAEEGFVHLTIGALADRVAGRVRDGAGPLVPRRAA